MQPVELNQFAFDHHLGKRNENIEQVEIAFAQRHLKRLHIKPVAAPGPKCGYPKQRWWKGGHAGFLPSRSRRHEQVWRCGSSQLPLLSGRAQSVEGPNSRLHKSSSVGAQPLAAAGLQVLVDGGKASTEATDSTLISRSTVLQVSLDEVECLARGHRLSDLTEHSELSVSRG